MTRPMDEHFARHALAIVRRMAEVSTMQPIDAREIEICDLERESVMLMSAWGVAVERGAATAFKLARRLPDA